MLAGVGGQHRMARPYSRDLRDRVVAAVANGRTCRATSVLFGVSVASVVKWSQRWRATGSAAAKPMGGRRPLQLNGEREWLLARIAEKPDLTLRAVVAELAERGTPASYGAVWRFFKHEGITFKKNSARQRAGSRRDLGQNQHDPPARALPPRRAAGRQGAARPLAHADLSGGAAPRPHHRALRHRRADQRRQLSRLYRAVPGADAQPRRHRRHGQSRQS